jgi:AcrR family transcriptional regulator
MRKPSELTRNAILKGAAELFCSRGYDHTSMDQIVRKLKMSKRTLYKYFGSKDDLFSSSMLFAIREGAIDVQAILAGDNGGVRKTLEAFARAYVGNVSTVRAIGVMRTIISISHRNGRISSRLFDIGPGSDWGAVAEYFDRAKSHGYLRDVDSDVLALHLKGLVESGIVEPLLHSTRALVDLAEAPTRAVDAFLRAYGTEAVEAHAG